VNKGEEVYLPATCQHCLADSNHTPLAVPPSIRCPVCGAAYSGPRRSREYQALVEAHLTSRED
jgi:hypothetical protein